MRTHLRKCRYPLCEFSGNNTRLQRTQTNTQDSFHLMYGTDQFQQIFPGINTVRTEMDSGQYDLLIPIGRQCVHLRKHVLHFTAAHPSSGIRDNAVRTELVASVLYLYIGSGMLCLSGHTHFLIFMGMCNVNQLYLWFFFFYFSKMLIQDCDEIFLFIIADDNVNAVIRFRALRLHITTRSYDYCIRIHFSGSVEHLSGFAVSHVGNRTGIDHIHICALCKRHDLITVLLQHLLHCLGFISIHLASKVMKCCFSHN